jgi:hypothetical protein
VQTHAPDYANHFFMELADPICAAPAEVVERYYRGLTRTWQAVDRMVGKLVEARDDETLVAVISDHGGTPGRWPHLRVIAPFERSDGSIRIGARFRCLLARSVTVSAAPSMRR